MTGNGGADSFAFTSALGNSNIDRITDFDTTQDRIVLDDAIFSSLSTGALSASNLRYFGTGPQDADDFLLYNPNNGRLFYDADGAGGNAAQFFLTLNGTPTIDAGDFVVV